MSARTQNTLHGATIQYSMPSVCMYVLGIQGLTVLAIQINLRYSAFLQNPTRVWDCFFFNAQNRQKQGQMTRSINGHDTDLPCDVV